MPATIHSRPAARELSAWQFRTDSDDVGTTEGWDDPNTAWPDARSVSVPHSWQEQSDLREYTGVGWYRTTVQAPDRDTDERTFLRFGAVDYEATAWVNGVRVGDHEGGYLPFALDVTDALDGGENTVVLRVEDPEDLSELPHGKQGEPWYTRVSGPWQAVELVTVPDVRVTDVRATPDLSVDTLTVELSVSVSRDDLDATVIVERDGESVVDATVDASAGTASLELSIPDAEYWTPDDPTLYDLRVRLEADEVLDTYETYVGMRSVAYADGTLLLNGDPFVMRGALDQAFYPETFYRPRDLDTFEREIRAAKEMGFNLLRKHIKPPHPAFVELADRVGMLVWSEPANPTRYTDRSKELLREQLFGLIDRDYNSPSVIAYSIYNEEWGIGHREDETALWDDPEKQDALATLYEDVRDADPTRLVCDNSGWAHVATDLNDYHEYFVLPDRADAWRDRLSTITGNPTQNYADPRTDPADAATVISEFGTWGLPDVEALIERAGGTPHWFDHDFLEGLARPAGVHERFAESHLSDAFDSLAALADAWQTREFRSIEPTIADMRKEPDIDGYVITELTDIEWEFNGLLDHDRTEKSFVDELARVNAPVFVDLEVLTPVAWENQRVSIDLFVGNDSRTAKSVSVTVEAEGVEARHEVSLEPTETVRIADALTVETPAVEAVSTVTVTADAPAFDRTVTRSITVAPDALPETRRVYTDRDALAESLADRGYETVTDPTEADVSVVTDPTAVEGPRLVVPDTDGHLDAGDALQTRDLPERESWNLCASFVHQSLFEALDVVPDQAFNGLYPYEYVTDCRTDDDVAVGYAEGWLANPGAIVCRRSGADELAVCTLRVATTYGDHPVGTAVVDRLLATLAE